VVQPNDDHVHRNEMKALAAYKPRMYKILMSQKTPFFLKFWSEIFEIFTTKKAFFRQIFLNAKNAFFMSKTFFLP